DVRALAGVQVDRQQVLARDKGVGQIERERREAAAILAQPHAIKIYGRGEHRALEIDEQTLAGRQLRRGEAAAIGRDELVFGVVEIAMRQHDIRVRQGYRLEAAVR